MYELQYTDDGIFFELDDDAIEEKYRILEAIAEDLDDPYLTYEELEIIAARNGIEGFQ
jgi:hypothetical protein